MNSDFKDLLRSLNVHGVKYLIIGGYAVSYYSEPRYTKDLEIWVEASLENSKKIIKALKKFGAPTDSLLEGDFAESGTLYVFGIPPSRVDILTGVKGVSFVTAWEDRNIVKLNNIKIPFVSIGHLKKLKKKAGRPQDLLDLEKL
jgi:hypothetical protein